jgi:hypothetical protein
LKAILIISVTTELSSTNYFSSAEKKNTEREYNQVTLYEYMEMSGSKKSITMYNLIYTNKKYSFCSAVFNYFI